MGDSELVFSYISFLKTFRQLKNITLRKKIKIIFPLNLFTFFGFHLENGFEWPVKGLLTSLFLLIAERLYKFQLHPTVISGN